MSWQVLDPGKARTDDEACWSCGYPLAVHDTAHLDLDPDPDGGCPADEIVALRRWGLM